MFNYSEYKNLEVQKKISNFYLHSINVYNINKNVNSLTNFSKKLL